MLQSKLQNSFHCSLLLSKTNSPLAGIFHALSLCDFFFKYDENPFSHYMCYLLPIKFVV